MICLPSQIKNADTEVALIAVVGPQPRAAPHRRRDWHPGTAAALSFLVPGLGQIYKGQLFKGVGLALLHGLTVVATLGLALSKNEILWPLLAIPFYAISWLHCMTDARDAPARL